MNYKMIRYMLGQVISTEGYLMLLPSLCSLLYGEHRHFFLFLSMSFFLIAGAGADKHQQYQDALGKAGP